MIGVVRPPSDETIIRSAAETPGCASHAKRWVLAATSLGSSLAFLEASVINVALPNIQDTLGASATEMQWIATAYTLLLAALTVVAGAAGDRFGSRRLFAIGTAGLGIASTWCGLSTSAGLLIAGRALQGLSAAMLVPNSLALLSASFPRAERGRVIGTWSAVTALTGAAGPILGGWLVDKGSWHVAFLLAVPLAVVTLLLTYWRVPAPPVRRAARGVDWSGAALATVGLGGVVFAIIASGSRQGDIAVVAGSAGVGVAALLFFLRIEWSAANPLLPLHLFRSPPFLGANLLTLVLYFAITAVFFLLPFNLIQVQGYSATQTGASFLPFALLVGLLSRWVGSLSDRLGAARLLIAGPLISAAGLLGFAVPEVGGSYATTFLAPMTVLGIGMALTVAPLTTTVMESVEASEVGVASGVNNTVARLAALLAVAVIGVMSLNLFTEALDRRLRSASVPADLARIVLHERRSFADTRVPESTPAAERGALTLLLGAAFVDSFRWMSMLCAAVTVAGAGGAALLIRAGAARRRVDEEAPILCTHLDQLVTASPSSQGCEECLRRGDHWVHLRLCLACGHVGCCDSSKNRHATAHFWKSQHAIIQSLEPGEDWRWCYVDEIVV